MTTQSNTSRDSVLDEIRSTIASFESIRSAAGLRRREPTAAPAAETTVAVTVNSAAAANTETPLQTKAVFPEDSVRETAVREVAVREVIVPETAHVVPASDPANAMSPPDPEPPVTVRAVAVLPSAGSDVRPRSDEMSHSAGPSAETHEADGSEEFLDDEQAQPSAGHSPGMSVVSRSMLRNSDKSAKIMIVDDEPLNVMTFRQHLKMDGYENFVTTSDPREALHLLRGQLPDVLLLDIRMPEISGLDILRVIGLDPVLQHIPVLILTAASDPATRKQALDLGASDFLQKPIDPNELLPRVRNAIVIKKHYDMVSGEAQRLEQQVERRTRQLEATRQQLILCLARAAEHRDNDTGNHVLRVGRYTAIIARQLGYPKQKLQLLEQAAQLHDVGKIGIPDEILFKPGKLEPREYALMKQHCALGKQIIEPISERDWDILKKHTRIGESMLHVRSSSLLMLAARIAQTHHEHWNGSGYPLGLQGEDIPLEGRMVAVADVFDALSSKRPYKQPFPREKCFEIIRSERGRQFDPQVVDAFFGCADEIVETQLILMDEEDRVARPNQVSDQMDGQ